MKSYQSSHLTPIPLELEDGTLTPDDMIARTAERALLAYFQGVQSGTIVPSISRALIDALPRPVEPRLDENGYWRLGAWLLESRSGFLALTYRPIQPEPRLEYIAAVRRTDGGLRVPTITMRQLYPRR